MKAGLLEKIRGFGHWRVNLRPLVDLQQPLTLRRANEVVEQASVSIRGWDFPHISRRNDDQGGRANMGDYAESWTDWEGFHEFWRMYRSSQFLFVGALHEDTEEWREGAPPGTFLSVLSAIYSITEFVEFTRRLTTNDLYGGGVDINVQLRGSAGRRLSAGRGRVPFFEPRINGADTITLLRRCLPVELEGDSRETSQGMILELFDHFGWNPDPAQIANDQDRFFKRQFGW